MTATAEAAVLGRAADRGLDKLFRTINLTGDQSSSWKVIRNLTPGTSTGSPSITLGL
jgi:hypothetical protein